MIGGFLISGARVPRTKKTAEKIRDHVPIVQTTKRLLFLKARVRKL